jgi:hypothetical protein
MISFWIKVGCLNRKWCNNGFYSCVLSQHILHFTVNFTMWLTLNCMLSNVFITFIMPYWNTILLQITLIAWLGNRAHCGWHQSTGLVSSLFVFHTGFMRMVNDIVPFPFSKCVSQHDLKIVSLLHILHISEHLMLCRKYYLPKDQGCRNHRMIINMCWTQQFRVSIKEGSDGKGWVR